MAELNLLLHIENTKSISQDPDRMGGQCCLAGSRIPISQMLAEIADGFTIGEVARDFSVAENLVKLALHELADGFWKCRKKKETETPAVVPAPVRPTQEPSAFLIKCDAATCNNPAEYTCGCPRCGQEDHTERYHYCDDPDHRQEVSAKHRRVRDRDFSPVRQGRIAIQAEAEEQARAEAAREAQT